MIKYCLKCRKCSMEFESWFSSSKEFDRLKKLKHINCQNCNSMEIEKSLMSPNLANTKKKAFKQNEQKIFRRSSSKSWWVGGLVGAF